MVHMKSSMGKIEWNRLFIEKTGKRTMFIESEVISGILEEWIRESMDDARTCKEILNILRGGGSKAEFFWQHHGGMKLAGVIWNSDISSFHVFFISGYEYFLPIEKLKGVRARDVVFAKLDDFEDGVVVQTAGGDRTGFPADFVLYHCEPRYRMSIRGSSQSKRESMAKRVGMRVRELRKRRGLSLREMARKAGMAVANASNLEAGKHEPKLGTLDRIAAVLGVMIVDIVSDQK